MALMILVLIMMVCLIRDFLRQGDLSIPGLTSAFFEIAGVPIKRFETVSKGPLE
jgi:hypothetical protein